MSLWVITYGDWGADQRFRAYWDQIVYQPTETPVVAVEPDTTQPWQPYTWPSDWSSPYPFSTAQDSEPTGQAGHFQVITYADWEAPLSLLQRLYLQSPNTDQPPAEVETGPPWVGRTWAPDTLPPQTHQYRWNPAQDESAREAEPHWKPVTWPGDWRTSPPTRLWTTAQDESAPIPEPETNPHWTATPWRDQDWQYLYPFSLAQDGPAAEPETSTFTVILYQDWQVPLYVYRTLWGLPQDESAAPQPETNPHWISKPWPLQWTDAQIYQRLWSAPQDEPVPFEPETNPHWRPTLWPAPTWCTEATRHLWTTARDESAAETEANPHWQSRPWETAWRARFPHLWTTAQDEPVAPELSTFLPWVARYWPERYAPFTAIQILYRSGVPGDFDAPTPPVPTDTEERVKPPASFKAVRHVAVVPNIFEREVGP